MDTSPQYIAMCRAATEIQGMLSTYEGHCPIVVYPRIGEHVWLPRQDELQAMFAGEDAYDLLFCLMGEAFDTTNGCIEKRNEYAQQFTSLEQLWLAAVMDQKHDKFWDPTEKAWLTSSPYRGRSQGGVDNNVNVRGCY